MIKFHFKKILQSRIKYYKDALSTPNINEFPNNQAEFKGALNELENLYTELENL